MATSYPTSLDQLPAELLEVVVQQAVADAEGVAAVLDGLGLRPNGEGQTLVQVKLPAYFLIGLAVALRMKYWEDCGLRAHHDSGLPSADEVVGEVAGLVRGSGTSAEKLSVSCLLLDKTLGVAMDRLAWAGRTYLDADLELGDTDEDTLVDALANLLWVHRHDGENSEPTRQGRP